MRTIRCLLSYHKKKLNDLPGFAIGVRDGVYPNTTEFPMPPIPEVDFQSFITDYQNKRGAYEQGGLAQKGPFQEARQVLLAALDQMAEYVTVMAKGNVIKIKLASTADTGYFYVTKKNSRTKTDKLSFKKYDPVARKHVEFKETKIK